MNEKHLKRFPASLRTLFEQCANEFGLEIRIDSECDLHPGRGTDLEISRFVIFLDTLLREIGEICSKSILG
jgi:hypothetical protein